MSLMKTYIASTCIITHHMEYCYTIRKITSPIIPCLVQAIDY